MVNENDVKFTESIFLNFSISYEYNWFYQPDPEYIILKEKGSEIYIYDKPETFEIIKKNNANQIWKTEYIKFQYNPDLMTSREVKVNETWELIKK